MTKQIMLEIELNKLEDEELLSTLGAFYQTCRDLEEQKKDDEFLQQLEEQKKEHSDRLYNDPIKAYKQQIKAARYLVKQRGLEFKIPEDK